MSRNSFVVSVHGKTLLNRTSELSILGHQESFRRFSADLNRSPGAVLLVAGDRLYSHNLSWTGHHTQGRAWVSDPQGRAEVL